MTEERDISCPYCKTGEVHEVKQSKTLIVHAELIEYAAESYHCDMCGRAFTSALQEDRNLETAYSIYRQRHNLLSPAQIKSIRAKYNLSRADLALLLGWNETAVHRYENGALQNIVHNQLLVLLDEPENARRILNLNRSRLPDDLASELNRRIDLLKSLEAWD